jgi:glycerol uptake facilitator-like aquaporin
MTAVARSMLAEAIGTFALVFAGLRGEPVLSFFLMFVIMAVATDGRAVGEAAAAAVAYQVVSRREASP